MYAKPNKVIGTVVLLGLAAALLGGCANKTAQDYNPMILGQWRQIPPRPENRVEAVRLEHIVAFQPNAIRLDEAERVLDGVRLADQDATWEQLRAQLQLKREAARSPEVEALEAELAKDPDNLDLRQKLAIQYNDNGMHREALETLFSILQIDRDHHDGGSRQAMLDIIATLGKGDPLAGEYQRKLFGLMY